MKRGIEAETGDDVVIEYGPGPDQVASIFCLSLGINLASLDVHLGRIPDEDKNKLELMRFRRKLSQSAAANNVLAMEGWVMALIVGMHAAILTIPLAGIGKKTKDGHLKRGYAEDKADFMVIAKGLHQSMENPPTTLKEWKQQKELSSFVKKYKGRDTLRNWLNEALPGVLQRGRPRNIP